MFVVRKIRGALFSCDLRLEIRFFALLLTFWCFCLERFTILILVKTSFDKFTINHYLLCLEERTALQNTPEKLKMFLMTMIKNNLLSCNALPSMCWSLSLHTFPVKVIPIYLKQDRFMYRKIRLVRGERD